MYRRGKLVGGAPDAASVMDDVANLSGFFSTSGTTYTTQFPATEAPIAQGTPSIWLNGGADGTHWQNVNTTGGSPGLAFGSGFAGESFEGGEFDDPIAHLNSTYIAFPPDQYVEGIVYKLAGYVPTSSHEIELLCRFAITAGNARGYECLWACTDGGIVIVRWNGPKADSSNSNHGFDQLASATVSIPADGDVMRVEVVGSVISIKINGTTQLSYDTSGDSTKWTDGQPGMGFWPRTGGNVVKDSLGWKQWTAGPL